MKKLFFLIGILMFVFACLKEITNTKIPNIILSKQIFKFHKPFNRSHKHKRPAGKLCKQQQRHRRA
jgi:hypothetical protein